MSPKDDSPRPGPAREPGLDVFRGCAVLLMFIVHARRLLSTRVDAGIDVVVGAALDAVCSVEPFIAACFLTIAGTSLALARQRVMDPRRWLRRLFVRAVGLYGLAAALFVPQFGVAVPDLLVSPGILSAIAVALLLAGAALARPRPIPWLWAVIGGSLLMTALFERTGRCVPGLNGGPGGSVPLIGFTAVGAVLGLGRVRHGSRAFAVATGIGAAATTTMLATSAPWTTLCHSFYPAHDKLVATSDLFFPGGEVHAVAFWNHSAQGFVALSGIVAGAMWVAAVVPWRRWPNLARGGLVGLIGRHALGAYVGHLLVLGLLELCNLTPTTPSGVWVLVTVLAAAAAAGGAGLEARRRARTSRGA
ncbi:MAG: DUF1624 domain-containing protein [Polyangiaceae bacterium]|nr:DUF1624 domain-containing protein [Polyangiaceae bacterium]